MLKAQFLSSKEKKSNFINEGWMLACFLLGRVFVFVYLKLTSQLLNMKIIQKGSERCRKHCDIDEAPNLLTHRSRTVSRTFGLLGKSCSVLYDISTQPEMAPC